MIMMKMYKKIIYFVIITMLLVTPTILMAQPPDDIPPDKCPNPNFPDCPIDSGTVFLVAVVIAIASIKAYKYGNEQKNALA